MEETKTHAYFWSKSWIEFTAPNTQGVYRIRDREFKAIFARPRTLLSERRRNPWVAEV